MTISTFTPLQDLLKTLASPYYMINGSAENMLMGKIVTVCMCIKGILVNIVYNVHI